MHCIKDSSDTDDHEIEVEKTPTKKKRARKGDYICSVPMEEALQRCSYKTYAAKFFKRMQQIYRRTHMVRCGFNKAVSSLLKSHISMSILL